MKYRNGIPIVPDLVDMAHSIDEGKIPQETRDAHSNIEYRGGRTDLVDICGELVNVADKEYCIYDGSREVWVPKRHVEFDPDRGVFTMPEWLAFKKELI